MSGMPKQTALIEGGLLNNMQLTKKEIDEAMTELQSAMEESFEASRIETNAKLAKTKAHYRLSRAREEVRALSFN